MTVATFNVNSIRARMPVLKAWVESAGPDIVALQETKVEDGSFPIADLEPTGYHVAIHGQKGYNGVAILSRVAPDEVHTGLGDPDFPEDCRVIRARFGELWVVGTYVPNGTKVGSEKFAYKLAWFERFGRLLRETVPAGTPAVWLGDINVAPTDEDVYEPDRHRGDVCFQPEEKEALARIVGEGWTDLFRHFTPGPGHYTFWEYTIPNGFKRNLGWRIDHVYANEALAGRCTACVVDRAPRSMERPSDHTPVVATFDLA